VTDDKKTQIGTPGRTQRPTGSQTPVQAAEEPTEIQAGPPQPPVEPQRSYLPPIEDPLIGKTLNGRYLITKKLGEGGMGSVYLATHNILEKQLALKILHGEFSRKPDLVERFMQEAKAASRIRNENVIDISDFGSTPEGYVFFAMELLVGHDLHEDITRARLSGQLLPWSRSKKIFLQICGALSAAHAQGIVHRDLKPENVYLVEFLGDPDFVKLLDFGIAKLSEAGGGDGEGGRKLTKTGMLFGTPEYMSPEQARGEHVDHRVDIYAMGCILFQLVTGRVPFAADNFMGVLALHLTEPPPMIPAEVFDRIGAPRGLADVIDHALAKDREQRFQTIDALANAVRAVCGDPAPGDRSQRTRDPSVPAPITTTTTRARNPTGPTPVTRSRPDTARQRTEWTGNLRVPEVDVEQRPNPAPRSKLPIVIAALVVLAGAGIAVAIVATRGGHGDTREGPGSSGSSGSAIAHVPPPPVAPDAAVVVVPPPAPDAAVASTVPAKVTLRFESTPKGAQVYESGTLLGKAPLSLAVDGDSHAHSYTFKLRGYADATVSATPDHDDVPVVAKLERAGVTPPPALDAGVAAPPADAHAVAKPPVDAAAPCPCTPEMDITDPCCVAAHGMHP
jgi:serine/threonine-protein kinase